jgi:hypothetical protein
MDLKSYITEYVSSGRRKMNTRFPTITDSAIIIEWLENNGFVRCPEPFTGRSIRKSEVKNTIRHYGPKIYNIGDLKSFGTHWVEFGNKDWWFKLRVDDDFKDFLDVSITYCSMRMVDLNEKDIKKDTTKFTDINDFASEIDMKL